MRWRRKADRPGRDRLLSADRHGERPEASGESTSDLSAASPAQSRARRIAALMTALIIGAIGGYVFVIAGMPLPWLLGAMTSCTIAALAGVPVAVSRSIRMPMISVIGVMLGSRFSPELFGQMYLWLPTMLWLVGFVAVAGFASIAYFRIVGRFDTSTSYFAGMPGGFMEMITMAEDFGAKMHIVALCHAARVFLLVLILPFVIQWLEGVELGPRRGASVSVFDNTMTTHFWYAATAAVGYVVGRKLRLPSGAMMGPFLLSAVIHIGGFSDFKSSYEVINLAQVVMGAYVGSSFAGLDKKLVIRVLSLSVGSSVLLITITMVFAKLASLTSAFDFVPLVLAYSPGGLAEMSLISLALHIETAFVTCHHFVRITLVIIGAGVMYRFIDRSAGKATDVSRGPPRS